MSSEMCDLVAVSVSFLHKSRKWCRYVCVYNSPGPNKNEASVCICVCVCFFFSLITLPQISMRWHKE